MVWLVWGAAAAVGIFFYEVTAGGADAGTLAVQSLLGTLPGLFLLGVARLTPKMGYGDGMVLNLVGLRVGYARCVALLCFSLLLLSLCSVVLLLCRRVKGTTRMPYLPFLAASYVWECVLQMGSK